MCVNLCVQLKNGEGMCVTRLSKDIVKRQLLSPKGTDSGCRNKKILNQDEMERELKQMLVCLSHLTMCVQERLKSLQVEEVSEL